MNENLEKKHLDKIYSYIEAKFYKFAINVASRYKSNPTMEQVVEHLENGEIDEAKDLLNKLRQPKDEEKE